MRWKSSVQCSIFKCAVVVTRHEPMQHVLGRKMSLLGSSVENKEQYHEAQIFKACFYHSERKSMTYILRVRCPPGKRQFTILQYSVFMCVQYKDRVTLGAVQITEAAIRFQEMRPSLFCHVLRRSLALVYRRLGSLAFFRSVTARVCWATKSYT